jgi:hypothetical protein
VKVLSNGNSKCNVSGSIGARIVNTTGIYKI